MDGTGPYWMKYGNGRGAGRGFRGRGRRCCWHYNQIDNDQQYPVGYTRWELAQRYGDPDRANFGCGPCGEAAYRAYKESQKKQNEKQNN